MQRINEDIKTGQLKQVYLLYGEEAYLRKQYKDRLKKALCADGDTMNFHWPGAAWNSERRMRKRSKSGF